MKKINLIVLTILICFIILLVIHKFEIHTKFEKSKHLYTIIFLLLLFYRSKNKNILKTIKKDFNNNEFLIYFIIVISFSVFVYIEKNFYENEKYLKKFYAIKEAIIALIIAYCARLDLVFIPFLIIYIFYFYYD